MSPRSCGLFSAAALQSGYCDATPPRVALECGAALATAVCGADDAAYDAATSAAAATAAADAKSVGGGGDAAVAAAAAAAATVGEASGGGVLSGNATRGRA